MLSVTVRPTPFHEDDSARAKGMQPRRPKKLCQKVMPTRPYLRPRGFVSRA